MLAILNDVEVQIRVHRRIAIARHTFDNNFQKFSSTLISRSRFSSDLTFENYWIRCDLLWFGVYVCVCKLLFCIMYICTLYYQQIELPTYIDMKCVWHMMIPCAMCSMRVCVCLHKYIMYCIYVYMYDIDNDIRAHLQVKIIHIYMYIYIYIYIYIYMIYICVYMYICIYIYMYIYVYICI